VRKFVKGQCLILFMFLILLVPGCGNTSEPAPALVLMEENVYTFSDGQIVSIWNYPKDSKSIYRLENGVELLAVSKIRGPENVFTGGSESIHDLSQTAQDRIIEFYRQQGALYSVEDYLEKAYAEYLGGMADPTFKCYYIRQTTAPDGSNDTLIYFVTTVLLPLDQNEYDEIYLTRAFDRRTGELIDGWDLYCAPEDEVKRAFLQNYSTDAKTMEAIYSAFCPEYVRLHAEGYELSFSIDAPDDMDKDQAEHQKIRTGTGGPYTDAVLSVLNRWAIPT
jgi:hypothetical protein